MRKLMLLLMVRLRWLTPSKVLGASIMKTSLMTILNTETKLMKKTTIKTMTLITTENT